jgi:hypothetical protein
MTKRKKPEDHLPDGRPTKYTEEMPGKMIAFFNRDCVTYDQRGNKKVVKFPTFERFAFDNDVHHETLLEWSRKHPAFSEAYKKCKEFQKDLLVEGGLGGHYNNQFAIFLAKNVTDLRDKVEHDLSSEAKESLKLAYSIDKK